MKEVQYVMEEDIRSQPQPKTTGSWDSEEIIKVQARVLCSISISGYTRTHTNVYIYIY